MEINDSNSHITNEEWAPKNDRLVISYSNLESTIEQLIDVIGNSPEFEKLNDKTQILFMKKGTKLDVRNRQSHSKDVAKLSEALAKKENMAPVMQRLAYLIGLCHDLGHTAFGHDGESRIDMALKHYQFSTIDFNEKFYGKTTDVKRDKPDYSFEHHAHSVRIFKKILKDNNITLSLDLSRDIEYGILCHSTSRVKNGEVSKPLWAIARFADKIYPYTDMHDILQIGLDIDPNILYEINKKPEYFDEEKDEKPFTEEDVKRFIEVLGVLRTQDGLETCINNYLESATLVKSLETDSKGNKKECVNYKSKGEVKDITKILKKVAKYLREERVLGKEEFLAQAMVDEVIEYTINQGITSGMELKDVVYKASIIVTNLTDTELRDVYSDISRDKEWQRKKDKNPKIDYTKKISERLEEYPIKLSPAEEKRLKDNPDIILQPTFLERD